MRRDRGEVWAYRLGGLRRSVKRWAYSWVGLIVFVGALWLVVEVITLIGKVV